jgi:hypothetical protein
LLGAALVAAAAAGWWALMPGAPAVGVLVRGGDGGGLPHATPSAENFDPPVLDAALRVARDSGAQIFLVARHGHVIAEYYGHGFDARSPVDAGGFKDALAGMAGGIALNEHLIDAKALQPFEPARLEAAIAAGAKQSYAEFLSQRIWQPINAADARLSECCFQARASDWLRIATLLMEDGRFEGTDVLPKGWAALMQTRNSTGTEGMGLWLPPAVHGGEPFAGDGVYFLKGPRRWRLWMVPTLDLAILFAARELPGSARWEETRLPNLVTRAVKERATRDPHSGVPGA